MDLRHFAALVNREMNRAIGLEAQLELRVRRLRRERAAKVDAACDRVKEEVAGMAAEAIYQADCR